jgi:sugar phosphate isomerase/epimerase
MRLGGPVPKTTSPEQWVGQLRAAGYSAAYSPLEPSAPDSAIRAFRQEAAGANIVIAEVGAWSNPLARDRRERAHAFEKCVQCLALADQLGARCCVNVAGSVGAFWCGPDPENTSEATFSLLVETVQRIVDEVQPTQTHYTLETSPWNYPYDVESYRRLLAEIDRPCVAVHFDPVNLINNPHTYFANGDLIREFLRELGREIKSCHAKDIRLEQGVYTVKFAECPPGEGAIDYAAFLAGVEDLDPDLPVMLEHLDDESSYLAAAEHLRLVYAEIVTTCTGMEGSPRLVDHVLRDDEESL